LGQVADGLEAGHRIVFEPESGEVGQRGQQRDVGDGVLSKVESREIERAVDSGEIADAVAGGVQDGHAQQIHRRDGASRFRDRRADGGIQTRVSNCLGRRNNWKQEESRDKESPYLRKEERS